MSVYTNENLIIPLTVALEVDPEDTQKTIDHKVRGICKNAAHDAYVEFGVRVGWQQIRDHGLIFALRLAREERRREWITESGTPQSSGTGPWLYDWLGPAGS